MKKYRIVKYTLRNGKTEYQVEENTLWGIPTPFWFKVSERDICTDILFLVCFDTLEQAEAWVKNHRTEVIDKKVVETFD